LLILVHSVHFKGIVKFGQLYSQNNCSTTNTKIKQTQNTKNDIARDIKVKKRNYIKRSEEQNNFEKREHNQDYIKTESLF